MPQETVDSLKDAQLDSRFHFCNTAFHEAIVKNSNPKVTDAYQLPRDQSTQSQYCTHFDPEAPSSFSLGAGTRLACWQWSCEPRLCPSWQLENLGYDEEDSRFGCRYAPKLSL